MSELNLETLAVLKKAGMQKPEGVPENDWLICDCDVAVVEPSVSVPSVVNTTKEVSVATQEKSYQPVSIEDLENYGMAVDSILKIKSGSFFLDKEEVKAPLKVKILFNEVKDKTSIKVDCGGGKVEYYHTYDGINEVRGGTFDSKVCYCKRINPNVDTYPSYDITMEVVEDVLNEQGKVVASVGSRIGHSTATTSFRNWVDFVKACKKAGIDISKNGEGVALAEISLETKKSDKFTWKVPVFKLVA